MAEPTFVSVVDPLRGATVHLPTEEVTAFAKATAARRTAARPIETFVAVAPVEPRTTLPARLTGRLVAPDGKAGASLRVEAVAPAGTTWARRTTTSSAEGTFSLALPGGPIPDEGLSVRVTGATGHVLLRVPRAALLGGDAGILPLAAPLAPLDGVLEQLGDLVATWGSPEPVPETGGETTGTLGLRFGEGDCARSFRTSFSVDQFGFCVLFRLVAPELWPPPLVGNFRTAEGRSFVVPVASMDGATAAFAERTPVTHPLDVTRLRRTLANAPETLPMAGTLGLGYTLCFDHVWEPAGFSLGNLVYSLALAPGEQQVVAVLDHAQSLRAADRQSLTVEERTALDAFDHSSAGELFHATLEESARSHSDWWSDSSSGGGGGGINLLGFLTFGGGGSSASSSGGENATTSHSRDFASSAVDTFHNELHRRASAARSTERVSVRAVQARDREVLTTKTVENHNRAHALTMQYWEVIRHFRVTTTPSDVQLVAFVPLLPIPWLPAGHDELLPDYGNDPTDPVFTRDGLLDRYASLVRHADLLERLLPPRLRRGLTALRRLVGTPEMKLEVTNAGLSQLSVSLTGTFLPFDELEVVLVDRHHRVVARATMTPVGNEPDWAVLPDGAALEAQFHAAGDRASLLAVLSAVRERSTAFATRSAVATLAAGVHAADLARIEVHYTARSFSHTRTTPNLDTLIDALPDGIVDWDALLPKGFTIPGSTLVAELGGPFVGELHASLGATHLVDQTALDRRLIGSVPWPTLPIDRDLLLTELAQIEAVLLHVRTEPMRYTRAVWAALTVEETTLLLEPYTVGFPGGNGAGDEVPLLECVDRKRLGFNGNCLVVPFRIPERLAAEVGFTTRDVQDALLAFHLDTFRLRTSTVALPTHGVLGEAVLGACSSAERIDLTRFWNWKDAETLSVETPGFAGAPYQLVAAGASPTPTLEQIQPTLPGLPAAVTGTTTLATALTDNAAALGAALDPRIMGATLADLAKLQLGSVGQDGKFVPGLLPAGVTAVEDATTKLVDPQAGLLSKLLNRDLQKQVDALRTQVKQATPAAVPGVAGLAAQAEPASAWVQQLAPADQSAGATAYIRATLGNSYALTPADKVSLFGAFVDKPKDTQTPDPNAAGKAIFRQALGLDQP